MAKRSKKAKIKGSKGAIVALVVIVVVFCVAMFVVDSNPTGVEVLDNLAHTVVQTIKSLLAGTENPEPPQPTPPVNSQTYNVERIQQEHLSIHFLQLGSDKTGDCVYIKAGETDLLIDAGAEMHLHPRLLPTSTNLSPTVSWSTLWQHTATKTTLAHSIRKVAGQAFSKPTKRAQSSTSH